ncbi:unnamed protein product [Clonostachys rosea f. rosea IK726]|uniref:Pectate lyase superfamily protein domain-containing protein n=2 Tax=Bionectria ochroleuca TaxID=29856 RepID=A0A0B7JTF7_BIOOC|nr:unnamed protein product [Clonostachys rosea f. rosea IK726]
MILTHFVLPLLPVLALASTDDTKTNALTRSNDLSCRKRCIVKSLGSVDEDDAPAVRDAFKKCGKHGKIVFEDSEYHINTVLNTTGLEDVSIDIRGELLWGTDIDYWLNNSLPVGYQNQSTAWVLGGDNIRINGFGTGTFNGNGDVWYGFIRQQPNTSNYPGRPHAITFNGLTNSVVKGLRFLRSQMWTMSIINSHNVDLTDIFVNNTGNVYSSSNTDGADTIRSSGIKFDNWTVYNGDDSISLKADSKNITITNSKFYNGLGIAIGSIGQYYGAFEVIENVHVDNIYFKNTLHAYYFKTWTADRNGYPPNGGGGGLGYAANMAASNLQVEGLRGGAVTISQCTRFSGAPGSGNCTNSEFQIRDLVIDGLRGTTSDKTGRVASFQCSVVAPCTNLALLDVDVRFSNGSDAGAYLCGNVVNPIGFNCTGPACEGGSSTGGC